MRLHITVEWRYKVVWFTMIGKTFEIHHCAWWFFSGIFALPMWLFSGHGKFGGINAPKSGPIFRFCVSTARLICFTTASAFASSSSLTTLLLLKKKYGKVRDRLYTTQRLFGLVVVVTLAVATFEMPAMVLKKTVLYCQIHRICRHSHLWSLYKGKFT